MDTFRAENKNRLRELAREKKLFIAILCCERLLDNYKTFSLKVGYGDLELLRKGVDYLLTHFMDKKTDRIEIEELIKEINKITPNTEDFSTILVSFALDACNAVIESLNFLLDSNDEKILDILVFTTDTVDMFIQEKENIDYKDPLFESIIANDEYMIEEKSRIAQQFKSLKEKDLTPEFMTMLREDNLRKKIIDTSIIK